MVSDDSSVIPAGTTFEEVSDDSSVIPAGTTFEEVSDNSSVIPAGTTFEEVGITVLKVKRLLGENQVVRL